MKRHKLKLRIFIFLIGFIGVLSMLTTEIPIPEDAEEVITKYLTPWQFKLLSLINPTLLLLLAVWVGTLLYQKVKLTLPIIEKLVYKTEATQMPGIIKTGTTGGLICGITLTIITLIASPFFQDEFIELGEKLQPSTATRLLYGGFTEEIIMRFGLMTFLVWFFYEMFDKLTDSIYWAAIIFSAILFGIGHFPIVYSTIDTPSTELLIYILTGNAVGGIIFGWLYWKKGLEAAIIAHMSAHVVLILGESIFDI